MKRKVEKVSRKEEVQVLLVSLIPAVTLGFLLYAANVSPGLSMVIADIVFVFVALILYLMVMLKNIAKFLGEDIEKLSLPEVKKLACYTACTMRLAPNIFKLLQIKQWDKVKSLHQNNSVCGIFNTSGLGFMFTNIPFDWK